MTNICPWCRKPEATEEIHDSLPESDRLAAIVERLPKTADGVPVTPGMVVYGINAEMLVGDTKDMFMVGHISSGTGWHYHALKKQCWPLFSTRAAAKAARANGGNQ